MPLIYIELGPEFTSLKQRLGTKRIRLIDQDALGVMQNFANDLPIIMAGQLTELNLDPSTPETGIRVSVKRRPKDEYVVNGEQLWFRIYLSETMSDVSQRVDQKHRFRQLVEHWFERYKIDLPEDTIFDFFPGPTYGCGIVNGEVIDW